MRRGPVANGRTNVVCGQVTTIRVGDLTFTVKDDSLGNKVIKCGVGHIWGTLETKNVTVGKNWKSGRPQKRTTTEH